MPLYPGATPGEFASRASVVRIIAGARANHVEPFRVHFARYQVYGILKGKEETTMKTKTNVKAGGLRTP